MDEPLFADKSHRPGDDDLAAVLCRAKRHWDGLVAHIAELSAGASAEWKFYSPKYGWTFVARDKRRNMLSLTPLARRFLASFSFGDKAVAAAAQADLPDSVLKEIRASPKYPEGRAVRIDVTSAADAAIVWKLLAFKVEN